MEALLVPFVPLVVLLSVAAGVFAELVPLVPGAGVVEFAGGAARPFAIFWNVSNVLAAVGLIAKTIPDAVQWGDLAQ